MHEVFLFLLAAGWLSRSPLFLEASGNGLAPHLLCIQLPLSITCQLDIPATVSCIWHVFTLLHTSYIQAFSFTRNSLSHSSHLGNKYLFLNPQLKCHLFFIASLDTPFTYSHTPRQNYFGLPFSFMHSSAVAAPALYFLCSLICYEKIIGFPRIFTLSKLIYKTNWFSER